MLDQADYVDTAAALMGLSIAPWRDEVVRYFGIAAAMAAVLDAYPLTPHDEPGEVFEPVVPSA